ncbi:hypothetical protein PUNSTDRAFT_146376 [Punctularia strigosozonata HHB-11173 SS5]|uniref:Secreted protein n=1 Tax=Punctularia strigosozonata (strain HHB-11173) TaxID=741275 RepID=R7S3H3_PUNST|nr:uncharacterized protein PUNSTDRAFT_146376 [Punctularia strigosozonata HHB-11173 SS5]EIN04743.1 hypothetical protein PUNSTDRAFT_146376 [Punctularia strigosozonata HHB-11173 SS5]
MRLFTFANALAATLVLVSPPLATAAPAPIQNDAREHNVVDVLHELIVRIEPVLTELGSIPPSDLSPDTVQPLSDEIQALLVEGTRWVQEHAGMVRTLARSDGQAADVAAMTGRLLWTTIPAVSDAVIAAARYGVGEAPEVSECLQGIDNAIVDLVEAIINTHEHMLDGLLVQFEPLIGDLLHLQYSQLEY